MIRSFRINSKGINYHFTLNAKYEIEQISNDDSVLWPDRIEMNKADDVLTKYTLTKAYEREKANILFLDYFKLPIQINQKAAIKALARSSVAAFFCTVLAILPIPIISAVICSHPILIIIGAALMALASVQIREPIVSLKF